jgi:TP901 family phage tail tape measure protein
MVRNPVASEEVQVAVSGDTTGFQSSIQQAAGQLTSFRGAAAGAAAGLAALAAAGFAKATQAAASFEESMVGVEKVTSAETAAALTEELRDMAETVPLVQKELAGISEAAGRLGIEGTENIKRFTRVTSEMVVSTDLTADQAADAFARLTELTDISTNQVRELGSSVNALSNNMATSSSEIVDSMLRSSAALSSLGVQAEDQLSLASALNEVSSSARRAGTRLRRVAQELQDPGKAEDFAAALGVSVSEFERMRQESPAKLIETLARTLGEGGDAADALRENLSSTSRQALSALSQNLRAVEQAQGQVNREFENAGSLTEEFEKAQDTFNSEVQRTKNALRNVGITTGNRTLPALTDLLGGVRGAIGAFAEFNEKTDGLAGSLGLAAGAIGGTGAALAYFATGPIGLAAAAVTALAAAVATDFAGIRSTGVRLAEDVGGTLSRSFSRLSNSALASVGSIIPEWLDFETALSQGIDTIASNIASMVDIVATGLEILLQNMRDAGKAAVAIANGEFKKAKEIADDSLENTKGDVEDFFSRLDEREKAARTRLQRRRQGLSGVPPDTGSPDEDETSGGPGTAGAGGGAAPGAGGAAADAASEIQDLGSAAQQTAEQLSTSEKLIRESEKKAKTYRDLGFEDRAKKQQAKADRLKKLRRQTKRAVVKDPDLSLFDGGKGGGGGSGGGAAEAAAPATGAGAAAGTGGSGGGGGAPAWTKSLNATLGSLQSSIEKLTATDVVADAVSEAVDGSTLILRGDLGDVATTGEVKAILRESSRREGRRARDLGRGGGIR